jgi:hypothetical protein
MESERLDISTHKVKVEYIFRNATSHDVDASIAFPLPELDGATVENSPLELPSKDPMNFVSFEVSVDGKPVSPKVQALAFKNGKDITNRLQSLGLPISVLDPRMKGTIDRLSETQLRELEHEELIAIEHQGTDAKHMERVCWPWWNVRVQYYWVQHFPRNSTVKVLHTYQPVVGGSYLNSENDGSSSARRYCGGAAALQQIKDVKAQLPKNREPDIALNERTISYILTTGNNWRGPIRDFVLSVEADSPDDIVLTCMPGLKKVEATRYEANFKNYRPDRELELLILQANR